ncbi:MAG: trehalase family glycosidase [bacterium]|nr:trehalase family glycosidase [bacterium]
MGCTSSVAEKLKKESIAILEKNRRVVDGYTYTVPSPTAYPHQWLWDSCFHAIALSHIDISVAEDELRALVSHQFENGMIPHMIYWQKDNGSFVDIEWGKEGTSAITQPPMIAYAVLQIYQQNNETAFLSEMYPYMHRFYTYLLTQRDPRGNHLIGIINPDESGEDNSPRFDIPLGLPHQHSLAENTKRRFDLFKKNIACDFDAPHCMKNFFWVKDVPFNAIMVKNLECLARIATLLGNHDDVATYKKEMDAIRRAMRERMYEDGVYLSTYGADYKTIHTHTWAIFAPLFAGLYSREEAEKLILTHLRNPAEFDAVCGVPTVAKNDPAYDPVGFWRGPVWMSVHWFISKGLRGYGFHNEADRIVQKSCELIQRSGFREYYHPDTGEGLGAVDFTWSALIVDMIND